jgi:hypothetical protein
MTLDSTPGRVGKPQRVVSLLLVSMLTSTFVTPAAFAQQQPPAENVAAARSLGLQGIKLADAGDCKSAIEKLSRAEALYHAPSILGRLGECQVAVGQVVTGTENLNRVVREELSATAPKAFKDAQTRARGVLNAALPKIARLTVKVDPMDAQPQVTVDGAVIPPALIGVERPTDPGAHEIVVTAPGYLEQRSNVTLAEGGSQEISLRLAKDPSAALPSKEPPPQPPIVAAVPPASPPADKRSGGSNVPAYVALGVGGTGLLVGGITGFLALGKKSDLKGCVGNACPTSQKDTLDSAKSMATISTVGFAVGFVGVGVGVVLLLTSNHSSSASLARPALAKREPRSGVAVEPWFSGTSAGLNGTF